MRQFNKGILKIIRQGAQQHIFINEAEVGNGTAKLFTAALLFHQGFMQLFFADQLLFQQQIPYPHFFPAIDHHCGSLSICSVQRCWACLSCARGTRCKMARARCGSPLSRRAAARASDHCGCGCGSSSCSYAPMASGTKPSKCKPGAATVSQL